MTTLDYIIEKYKLDIQGRQPTSIPDVTRVDLAQLFHELDYRLGVEVGVEKGLYSEVICQANPQAVVFSIDPWVAYAGYREHISQGKMDNLCRAATKRLSAYKNSAIAKKFSMEAVKFFPMQCLDFVYIDGNHDFENVALDLVHWTKRVRPGGIVSGHDFKRHRGSYICHVKDVVQAYTYSHGINPWFVLRGDKSPSWFWVKG
jgi:hypothetical protein